MILAVILYFVIDIRSQDVTENKTDSSDIITISKDTATKVSLIMTGNGDTLYALKGNSILIDRIGSDTFNTVNGQLGNMIRKEENLNFFFNFCHRSRPMNKPPQSSKHQLLSITLAANAG
jgi:hypothetical protein